MKVHRTRVVEGDGEPGRVLSASKSIVVGTGSGALEASSKYNCLGAAPSPGGM